MSYNEINLGENIYRLRTSHNLSQGDLANALDVSRQTISKWENYSAVPELDKIMKMSSLFGVTMDELVNGNSPSAPVQQSASGGGLPPARIIAGGIMLLFGMVFFLLSIFWGDHLRIGEELGEIISISIVFLGVALLATYNKSILAICGVIYMVYAIVSVGIMNVTSLTHYMFMFFVSIVLLVWFIVWGYDGSNDNRRSLKTD